jgi:hypothetical protein
VVRGCGFVLNFASAILVILFAVDSVNANMEGGGGWGGNKFEIVLVVGGKRVSVGLGPSRNLC